MTQTLLVTYTDINGQEVHKLVEEKHFDAEHRPAFEIDGISIFDIVAVQPYL